MTKAYDITGPLVSGEFINLGDEAFFELGVALSFIRRNHHVPLMWLSTEATRNLNAPYAHAEA